MKLASQQEHPAILSNVGEIGEFRIRNSAKAFNILSSGLYANKIRAIIRELSCNAVDSHVAAGKANTPFDVHLPNQLEPWFAIRDYGTGLSHEQVTNIYTTYFESTKTDSNEFIGALGLGSKSPFSYTDNFTVTAIKDGRRGIYSAFINEQGVPSIALMMEEQTTEPNGVEVKFSVNSTNDYYKFVQEAQVVYTYFTLRPVVSGSSFTFSDVQYIDKDIVPGVHSTKKYGPSTAVMGNIAYPISVPNAETVLDGLTNLLSCGLELHFEIGELDFQASREGLSYIPSTIESIKKKLEALSSVLDSKLEDEADRIPNLWQRAEFLFKKKEQGLWSVAVKKYVTKKQFPLINSQNSYFGPMQLDLYDDDVASKFNVEIRGFRKNNSRSRLHEIRKSLNYDTVKQVYNRSYIALHANSSIIFVKNDLKTGVYARLKHHMRTTKIDTHVYESNYFVLTPVDPKKPADFDGLLKSIYNPPRVMLASVLAEKPRSARKRGINASIVRLERRGDSRYGRNSDAMVWRAAGELKNFNSTETFYYLPLVSFQVESKHGILNPKHFYSWVVRSGFKGTSPNDLVIYGVRKADLPAVQACKNWINLEEHIEKLVVTKSNEIEQWFAQQKVQFSSVFLDESIVEKISNTNSEFLAANKILGGHKITGVYNECAMDEFFVRYLKRRLNVHVIVKDYTKKIAKTIEKYNLLKYLTHAKPEEIAEYVNMVDMVAK